MTEIEELSSSSDSEDPIPADPEAANGTTPEAENIAEKRSEEEEKPETNNDPENYDERKNDSDNPNQKNESDNYEQQNNELKAENSESKLFDVTQPREVVQPKEETNSSALPDSAIPDEFDNDLDRAIDQLVNRFVLPPPELRNPIMQLVERRRVEALVEGDYDMAEQQDKIAGILNMVIQQEQQKLNEDRTIDKLYSRWQQLTHKQNQITAKWDKKIADFIAESDQQKIELDTTHEQEIDTFINKWKDPNFLRPFNKPSSRLLQLREQEKAMAISRMYAQAKEMKAIADRLQREETQAAQAKINATMTMERNKLAVKQNKEVSAWNSYRNRMIKSMQTDKQKELRPIVTAMHQIKAKKTAPSRMPSSLPNLPNNKPDTAVSESSLSNNSNNYSPRTQAIYSHFRSEKKTTLLDVGPVDEQTLLAMKKPTTARSRSGIATRGPTVKRTPVSKRLPRK
ncbi:hypothetical protein TRFO_10882 [Tritrichomonas foetus]|uniref:Uncharacterized protein n=1 Tax=Tritrichomonas foetus TaxID=1144522 RepID=A0A1J4J7U3_9EUKA|nr:hypothetical protein TRFO_10882 [Tritrichomonas foetus]|eukprot:OHS94737.1 hypothetical protein TRFO_10882 [Tritrichomonas foetus]